MKQKKIWIVRTMYGNPFDLKDGQERAVGLAAYLSNKGYDVTYWGTTFNHIKKEHIWNSTIYKKVKDNEYAVMIHSPIVYKKNLSPMRLFYSRKLAQNLETEMFQTDKYQIPDAIFVAYPQEETCRVAEKYGKKYGVPVIVDVRDLWPDIFDKAFPKPIRPISPILLSSLKKRAAKTLNEADAICAMSTVALDWALDYARRPKRNTDNCVFIGKRKTILDNNVLEKQLLIFNEKGISSDTWNICLFSSLSLRGLDLETMIEGINAVHNNYPKIRLIIGGRGDAEEKLRKMIEDLPYIHMMGYMNEEQMVSAMMISKVGLIPYKNQSDLKNAWGNKIGQYLSQGLPLLNSTEGIAKTYINDYGCGVNYKEGNPKSLVNSIIELINNPDLLKKMSNKATERYEKDFREDANFQKIEDMICNLIK